MNIFHSTTLYAVGSCPYFKGFLQVFLCSLLNDRHTFLTLLDLHVQCSRYTIETCLHASFSLFKSPDSQELSDKWTEIEFAFQMLGISEEEAKGIWAILAAICHLGCAGVTVGNYYNLLNCSYKWMDCEAIKAGTCLLMSYMRYTYIAQCNVSFNLLLLSDVHVIYKCI